MANFQTELCTERLSDKLEDKNYFYLSKVISFVNRTSDKNVNNTAPLAYKNPSKNWILTPKGVAAAAAAASALPDRLIPIATPLSLLASSSSALLLGFLYLLCLLLRETGCLPAAAAAAQQFSLPLCVLFFSRSSCAIPPLDIHFLGCSLSLEPYPGVPISLAGWWEGRF